MEKIIRWVTGKFSHPLSFLFFLLGAVLLFLGLTTGIGIPGWERIVPATDYQVVSMIMGVICLFLSVYIFYRPPRKIVKRDQENSESPDSFLARKALITKTQRDLLEFIEKKDTILQSDIHRKFSSFGSSELFYRLEQLRLLGFIEREKVGKAPGTNSSVFYRLSEEYRQEIKSLIGADSTTQEKSISE